MIPNENYTIRVFTVNTAAGLADYEIVCPAEQIYYATGTPTVTVKLNKRGADAIPLEGKQAITIPGQPFDRVFLNCAPLAGTITLVFSNPAYVQIVGNGTINISDLQAWGGTALTGRDISLDLAKLQTIDTQTRGMVRGDDGTQIAKGSTVSNNTVIVHTVTAGRVLLLEELNAFFYQTAPGTATIHVRDAGDVLQYNIHQYAGGANSQENIVIPYNSPLRIPAGWDLCISTNVADFWLAFFMKGREVNA